MAKLGILTLHGMGKVGDDFDQALRKQLRKHWSDEIEAEVAFQEVHYHPAMQDEQKSTLDRMQSQTKHLIWNKPREFFMYAFSDAVTYHMHPDQANSVYQRVHQIIKAKIEDLQQQLEPDSPIVVIAQSLGGQVISNYIWDVQKHRGIWQNHEPEGIHQLKQLRLMLTTGCNIPLFVAGLKKEEIVPIAKPHSDFEWLNFFDKDDVLGWPLEPLSDAYQERVQDRPMDAGWIISNLTPFSHTQYWTDKDFVKPAAQAIADLYQQVA